MTDTAPQIRDSFRSLVAESALFADLDDEGRARLVEGVEPISFDEGSEIIKQGDTAECLYFIVEGTVHVTTVEGRTTLPLAELGRGACVGEAGLVSAKERTATVMAKTRVDCVKLEAKRLAILCEAYPSLRTRLHGLVEARAEDTVRKLLAD